MEWLKLMKRFEIIDPFQSLLKIISPPHKMFYGANEVFCVLSFSVFRT